MEPHPSAPQAFSELDGTDTDAFLRLVTGHVPWCRPSRSRCPVRSVSALAVRTGLPASADGCGARLHHCGTPRHTRRCRYLRHPAVSDGVHGLRSDPGNEGVPDRPQITALALALMAALLVSTAAAAVLHGAYYFEWIARPVIG